MIDHLWRERLALTDMLIAPGPRRCRQFNIARHLETLRRVLILDRKNGARQVALKSLVAQQPPDDLAGRRHRHFGR